MGRGQEHTRDGDGEEQVRGCGGKRRDEAVVYSDNLQRQLPENAPGRSYPSLPQRATQRAPTDP